MEREGIASRILSHVQEPGIQPFRGRVPPGLARSGPKAMFFKVTCRCSVTAMLSVDIPAKSTDDEVEGMIPHLAAALDRQARQFHRFPCESHARMSIGGGGRKQSST